MSEPAFLTLAEVIEIHADQILNYGGGHDLRDIELLSSAVAMPYVSFSKQFLHIDVFEMAAAYAFHISQNHSFIDGNKRTALTSALVFLELNGINIVDPEGALYDAMLALVSRKLSKSDFAEILRKLGT
jgi:death-on-curing protein